jgi:hypothetical protein
MTPARHGKPWGWRALLREPLLHFLCAGGLLFLIFQHTDPQATSGAADEIQVDRDIMLNYLQYRSKAFRRGKFLEQWNAMTPAQRQALVDDYVHEEALFRAAQAMGLREGDYVIRQRMIQRLKFLIEDAAADLPPPTEAELRQYFSRHRDDYREPAVYTFTHVFFDAALHGDHQARKLAEQNLGLLRRNQVSFTEATRYGERFPYLRNYVERRADYVASQFGSAMLNALDRVDTSTPAWTGPYRSPYGWHLVLLTRRLPAHLPDSTLLQQRIKEDFQRDQRDTRSRAVIDQIVSRYGVKLPDGWPQKPG